VRSSGVHLREVTDENRAVVCALRVRPDQERFVASVASSLDDAVATPEANPWYRAVYVGNEPVGFVMLSWNVPPGRPGIIGSYFLWRLLIDQHHQGRGVGREVLRQVVDLVRAEGATELLTSYEPGAGEPWPFYRRFGFKPTGEVDDGEVVLRLTLSGPRPHPGAGLLPDPGARPSAH
jgi:diamine N-acetyltransferase